MKKLAIFVEGQTEQIFIEKLILEIAGRNHIQIDSRKASGGANGTPRITTLIRSHAPIDTANFYVLIFDCGTDNRVASDIKDRYDGLASNGYQAIIGIRDVFPDFKASEIPELRRLIGYGIPTKPINPVYIFGVMEIESWFIGEISHYEKIHNTLTLERIQTSTGFNPATHDLEALSNPAHVLDTIYALAGFRYTKSRRNVERTIETLDYANIYLQLGSRFTDLDKLNRIITEFITY